MPYYLALLRAKFITRIFYSLVRAWHRIFYSLVRAWHRIFDSLVRASHRIHSSLLTKTDRLTLFRDIIAVYFEQCNVKV